MPERINLNDQFTVEQIIREIEMPDNLERKRRAWRSFKVVGGEQRRFVIDRLKTLFPKSYQSMRVSDVSIAKKITNKRAKAYKQSPIRRLQNELQTEELNELYKRDKFNSAWKLFDWNFNQFRDALFWVNWDPEATKFRPQIIYPFEYDIIRDQDTGELLMVALSSPDRIVTEIRDDDFQDFAEQHDGLNKLIAEQQDDTYAQQKQYALWTPENNVLIQREREIFTDGEGKTVKITVEYLDIPGNPGNVNILGELPFVYRSAEQSFDYPTNNPLAKQSIDFNVLWSDLLSAASLQGFGQLKIKYPASMRDAVAKIHTGLTTAIELPQSENPDDPDTDADYINPKPDLAGQRETYLTYLRQILSEHGITTSQAITGDNEKFASGFDRLIAQADVQDVISDNQDTYADAENDVYKKVVAWFTKVIPGSPPFPADEELQIIYPKPKVMISDGETLDNIKKRMDLGLTDRVEALMILDPNLTKEDAEKRIAEIDKAKADAAKKMMDQLGVRMRDAGNRPGDVRDGDGDGRVDRDGDGIEE